MGSQFVYFKCQHSNHCCRDVVCLPTPWDVLRIAVTTGADPRRFVEFLTPEEITGVEKNDPTWLHINGDRFLMALWRDPEEGCYFLGKETKYCTIYEQRPILCRLYPFKLHETREGEYSHFTLHKDVGCPRDKGAKVATAPLYELYLQDKMHQEDYVTLVETFNEKASKDTRPEDFLNLFLEIVVES